MSNSSSTPQIKMPNECFAAIFQYLDKEDEKAVRKVCPQFNMVYEEWKHLMPGPSCNVTIEYYNGELKFYITSLERGSTTKTVTLSEWRNEFLNAKCRKMSIRTDRNMPADLMNQLFICQSILKMEFYGRQLDEELLKKLSPLVNDHIRAVVVKLKPEMEEVRKLKDITVVDKIEHFYDLVKVMETVSKIHIWTDWTILGRNLTIIRSLKERMQCLPNWTFELDDHGKDVDYRKIYKDFKDIINDIFGYTVYCYFQRICDGFDANRTIYVNCERLTIDEYEISDNEEEGSSDN
ncbi:unnamed protein product [Caenorhabditis angaria]|uniref:F-box domain-containing protein n=1 Tax=Caenorhabditis angaria TaxID=860376 RepID=A0A9P1J1N8_9PELO|nr:unnamed protein product [Caenorhabditis angaria]